MTAVRTVTPENISFAGVAGNRLAGDLWISGDAGSKPTALLLHGGGQTRRAWDRAARDLADAGFTAITVDQRGHGESDWLADGAYAFADYGADAVQLGRQIAERFGQMPVVIGASLGGLAAMLAEGEAGPEAQPDEAPHGSPPAIAAASRMPALTATLRLSIASVPAMRTHV